MLDLGFVEKAEKLRDAMFDTIAKSKKASDQISTIVDLVPLMTKLKGPEETLPVVEKGIELIGAPAELMRLIKDYLTSQAQILRARMNGELDKLATLYADVVSRNWFPCAYASSAHGRRLAFISTRAMPLASAIVSNSWLGTATSSRWSPLLAHVSRSWRIDDARSAT